MKNLCWASMESLIVNFASSWISFVVSWSFSIIALKIWSTIVSSWWEFDSPGPMASNAELLCGSIPLVSPFVVSESKGYSLLKINWGSSHMWDPLLQFTMCLSKKYMLSMLDSIWTHLGIYKIIGLVTIPW